MTGVQRPELGGAGRPRLWTREFLLIIFVNFVMFCGYQMFPSGLPPWVKSLGATDAILGWLTGIATLGAIAMRPFAALALDQLGRQPVFRVGLVFLALTTAAHYFFPVVGIILVLRLLHGLAWGAANTAGNTIGADAIPKERFGEGMGYFSLSTSLSIAIAPAIALALPAGVMIWTSTILTALAFCLSFLLIFKALPERAPQEKRHFAPYALSAVPSALVIFLNIMTYGCLVTFLALYAAQFGIANIGGFFTLYAVSMLLVRPLVGKMVDRFGFFWLTLISIFCVAATLVLVSQARGLPAFLIAGALYGVGKGGVQTSTQTMALLSTTREHFGAANATYFTGFDSGLAVGAVIAGLLASHLGYSAMFLILAIAPALSGAVYLAAVAAGKMPK